MSKEKPLDGKVALITGASRGIGLSIAQSLATMGAKLGLCARDPKRLSSAAAELERQGASVVAVPADVSRPNDISALAQKTEQSLGPIEILINNAGIGYFRPHARSLRGELGLCIGHQFEIGVPAEPGRSARNDLSPQRPHRQYRLARWEKRLRRRRHLLRVKMGASRTHRMHGRRSAPAWHPSQRRLPRIGGHRFLVSW